jgi:hypothetical protein
MKRREFLAACSGMAAAALAPHPAGAWAADLPRDLKVTRIVAFDLVSLRPKKVGKNSRLGDHGDRGTDRMVRLFTRAGLEGLGNCRADEATLAGLLGENPLEFFKADEPAMKSPLGPGSMPLWDLAGKALGGTRNSERKTEPVAVSSEFRVPGSEFAVLQGRPGRRAGLARHGP